MEDQLCSTFTWQLCHFPTCSYMEVRYRRSKFSFAFWRKFLMKISIPGGQLSIVNAFLSSCMCHPNTGIILMPTVLYKWEVLLWVRINNMLLSKCFSNIFSKQDLNRGLSAEYCVITVFLFAFYCEWKILLSKQYNL